MSERSAGPAPTDERAAGRGPVAVVRRLDGPVVVLVGSALIGVLLAGIAALVLARKMRGPLEDELFKRSAAVCRATAADLRYPVTVGDPEMARRGLAAVADDPAVTVVDAWLEVEGQALAVWHRPGTPALPAPPPLAAERRFVAVGHHRYALTHCAVLPIADETLDEVGEPPPAGTLSLLVDTADVAGTVRRGAAGALGLVGLAIAVAMALQFLIARFVIVRLRQAVGSLRVAQEQLVGQHANLGAAHRQLEGATAMLRDVFRAMPEAVIVVDAGGVVGHVNEAAVAMFGAPEAELVGQPAEALFAGDGAAQLDLVRAHASAQRTFRSELSCRTRAGDTRPVLFSATGAGAAAGRLVCVALDLRERKRLELELRQAQKLESVGRLAAGVAHEINTPVQYVSDSLEFLREATGDLVGVVEKLGGVVRSLPVGAPVAAALAEVEAAEAAVDLPDLLAEIPAAFERSADGLARVAAIVRSMKDFAHPASRQMTHVDLERAIASTLTLANNEYKYVADVETCYGDLPPVWCNAGEIHQVILNIVVNAAHAVADAVSGTRGRGRIRVETRCDGADAVVSISDTGLGIPEEIRGRIFDPFFTTKAVGRGTGQGLAIAHSFVVDSHGGSLWFDTVLGQGTTFHVRIPIAGRRRS